MWEQSACRACWQAFRVVQEPLGRALCAASVMGGASSHLLKGNVAGSQGGQGPLVTQL